MGQFSAIYYDRFNKDGSPADKNSGERWHEIEDVPSASNVVTKMKTCIGEFKDTKMYLWNPLNQGPDHEIYLTANSVKEVSVHECSVNPPRCGYVIYPALTGFLNLQTGDCVSKKNPS